MARFRLPDGRVLVFPRLGEGWDRAVGDTTRLTVDPDSDRLRITSLDGSWWSLAPDGTLLGFGTGPVSDLNWVELVRDETGRLTGLVHGRGRSLDLEWGEVGGDPRIIGLTSSDGRAHLLRL